MAKNSNSGTRRVGGGPGSRINKSVPVRTGAPASGVRPGAVSQMGESLGNKAMGVSGKLRGAAEKYSGPAPTNAGQRLGNEVAASTVCGVGGSRTVMRSGSQQGTAATPRPMNGGRDILSEYGPDSANVRGRR